MTPPPGVWLAALLAVVVASVSPRAQPKDLPRPVSPFPAGLSGTLAFQSDRAGRTAIYTLDLRTGRVRHLSGDPRWSEADPRWSPDGSTIVFASNRAHFEGPSPEQGTPDMDLWLMSADGSGRRRLTTDPSEEQHPSWAADGRSVFFSSDRDSRGDLYRLWLDSGKVDRLTRHFVGRAIMPSASPDGSRVAFAAQTLRAGAFWDYQVHVLDLSSGKTEAVPSSAGACWPSWSRDRGRLASVLLRPKAPSGLQVRETAGGAARLAFVDDRLWSYYPEWSPDDARLAFSVSPAHREGEDWDLAVVEVATGKWQRLTSGPGNDRLPDWRP